MARRSTAKQGKATGKKAGKCCKKYKQGKACKACPKKR